MTRRSEGRGVGEWKGVSHSSGFAQVATLKANYFQWLTETGQEEKAAELKEREGDLVASIYLFLKGGLPARAAAVVNRCALRGEFESICGGGERGEGGGASDAKVGEKGS